MESFNNEFKKFINDEKSVLKNKLIKYNFSKKQLSAIRTELIKKLKIFSIGAKKRQKLIEYKNAIKRIDELSFAV